MDYVKLLKVDAGPDAMKVVENGVTYKIPYGEVYKVNGKMREVIKPGKPYPGAPICNADTPQHPRPGIKGRIAVSIRALHFSARFMPVPISC